MLLKRTLIQFSLMCSQEQIRNLMLIQNSKRYSLILFPTMCDEEILLTNLSRHITVTFLCHLVSEVLVLSNIQIIVKALLIPLEYERENIRI